MSKDSFGLQRFVNDISYTPTVQQLEAYRAREAQKQDCADDVRDADDCVEHGERWDGLS